MIMMMLIIVIMIIIIRPYLLYVCNRVSIIHELITYDHFCAIGAEI